MLFNHFRSQMFRNLNRLVKAQFFGKVIAGFVFLPFVWLVNAVWFFKEAFRKPPFEEQKAIKKYVILSSIGASIWAVVIAVWVYIFQTHRAEWGEFGDQISFIIPTGIK